MLPEVGVTGDPLRTIGAGQVPICRDDEEGGPASLAVADDDRGGGVRMAAHDLPNKRRFSMRDVREVLVLLWFSSEGY